MNVPCLPPPILCHLCGSRKIKATITETDERNRTITFERWLCEKDFKHSLESNYQQQVSQ